MLVRIRLGPLPSGSARAWIGYARDVLSTIQGGGTPLPPLPGPLADAFARYLAAWDACTAREPFVWESEEDRDLVAELATSWLDLMAKVSGRVAELGLPVGPKEGEAFYHALVAALGDALSGGAEGLGAKLREAWPAIGDIDRGRPGGVATTVSPPRALRVVIADDASDLRAVVRIALQHDERFEVVAEAADGIEAVAACRAHRPDVVLLDLVMPRMDGWAALGEIKRWCPEAAVVIVSTLDAHSAEQRAVDAGAAAYVQKSISLVSLTDTIAALAS